MWRRLIAWSERPQRLRENRETAMLALTTTFKLRPAAAEGVVRRAHIAWADTEGEAIVKCLHVLRQGNGSR